MQKGDQEKSVFMSRTATFVCEIVTTSRGKLRAKLRLDKSHDSECTKVL